MQRDTTYLFTALSLMDALASELPLDEAEIDAGNRYKSILSVLHKITSQDECIAHRNDVLLTPALRNTIEKFLNSLEIVKLDKLLGKIKYLLDTGKVFTNEEDIVPALLSDLGDLYLLRFLVMALESVTYVQFGDFLLSKYSKSMQNVGWNNLAKTCRGKVIDLKKREIVAYPFDKFFNLTEMPETNLETISRLVKKARYISVVDKKDGSTIIVTKHNGSLIITTNGDIDNIQTAIAKELLKNKYTYFMEHLKEGMTYIFELIHPEDRKVIDYGLIKELVFIGARDLITKHLYTQTELITLAEELHLNTAEVFGFEGLDALMSIAKTVEGANREGWVIRVITDDTDIMFKLKYDEYVSLHRSLLGDVNVFNVYELMQNETLDDVFARATDTQKMLISTRIDEVVSLKGATRESLENALVKLGEKFPSLVPGEFDEIAKDRSHPKYQERVNLIQYTKANLNTYYNFCGIMTYYRDGNQTVDEIINNMPLNHFRKIYKEKKQTGIIDTCRTPMV